MNLYQKIVAVREVAGGFTKDSKSYSYDYVSGNQILSKIKDTMNEHNLLLIPSTRLGEHSTQGKDIVVKGEMTYTWINGDNPEERLEIPWAYYGQQNDISKAYGSALTYSERYFLLKCLGLPTDEDDPDGREVSRGPAGKPGAATEAPWGDGKPKSSPPAPRATSKPQSAPRADKEAEAQQKCADCDTPITVKVAGYSVANFKRPLCMACQDKARKTAS